MHQVEVQEFLRKANRLNSIGSLPKRRLFPVMLKLYLILHIFHLGSGMR